MYKFGSGYKFCLGEKEYTIGDYICSYNSTFRIGFNNKQGLISGVIGGIEILSPQCDSIISVLIECDVEINGHEGPCAYIDFQRFEGYCNCWWLTKSQFMENFYVKNNFSVTLL